MVKEHLVTKDLNQSAALLSRAVRIYGLEVALAFWIEEEDGWRLYFVCPEAEGGGLRKCYRKIFPAIDDLREEDPEFDIDHVRVISPSYPLAESMMPHYNKYSRHHANGVDFVDVGPFIILRLNRDAVPA